MLWEGGLEGEGKRSKLYGVDTPGMQFSIRSCLGLLLRKYSFFICRLSTLRFTLLIGSRPGLHCISLCRKPFLHPAFIPTQ